MSDFFFGVLVHWLAGFFVGVAGAATTGDHWISIPCGISAGVCGAVVEWRSWKRARRAGKPRPNDVVPNVVATILGSAVAAFAVMALQVGR